MFTHKMRIAIGVPTLASRLDQIPKISANWYVKNAVKAKPPFEVGIDETIETNTTIGQIT